MGPSVSQAIFAVMFLFLQTKGELQLVNVESGNYDPFPTSSATTTLVERVEKIQAGESWEAPKSIRESFPYYVSGFDDDGRPIFVFEFGKYNYRRVFQQGKKAVDDTTKHGDQTIRRTLAWAEAVAEDGPGDIVLIFDFDGFKVENLASVEATRFGLNLIGKFGPVHPKLGYGFIINANFVAASFINLLKPYLGEMMEKMEQFGVRKDQWLPRLLKRIPVDQLPPWYGGHKDFKPVVVY